MYKAVLKTLRVNEEAEMCFFEACAGGRVLYGR